MYPNPVARVPSSIRAESSWNCEGPIVELGGSNGPSSQLNTCPCPAANATAAVHAGSLILAKTIPMGSKRADANASAGVCGFALLPGTVHDCVIAFFASAFFSSIVAGIAPIEVRRMTLLGLNARTNIGEKKSSSIRTGQRPRRVHLEISSRYVAASGTSTTLSTMAMRART